MSDISVSGITKEFVLKDRTITAVDNISLSIQDGDFITVVGPSGCGKSTLLHIIGGLLAPDKGSISFEKGTGRCGFVFQEPRLLNSSTVRQNLMLAMKHIKSNKEKEQVLAETLSFLELLEFIDAYPNQLSGGMAQRAAIGRALCRQPDVMLMDEPFSALDTLTRTSVQEWYLKVMEEIRMSTLFITHDIDEAILLSDRIYIMKGSPASMTDELVIRTPRPRDRDYMLSEEFLAYKRQIRSII